MAVINLINFTPIKRAWIANRSEGGHCSDYIFHDSGLRSFHGQRNHDWCCDRDSAIPEQNNETKPGFPWAAIMTVLLEMQNVSTFQQAGILLPTAWTALYTLQVFNGSKNNLLHFYPLNKKLSIILIEASGINSIDSSGEWGLFQLLDRFSQNNLELIISGLKHNPYSVLDNTGLLEKVGENNIFRNTDDAIEEIYKRLAADGKRCPEYSDTEF